jgi:hypothetical protein
MTVEYMGYYSSGGKVYIRSNGQFYFRGDSSNYIQWNGATLTIAGDGDSITNIDGGNIQTNTITATQIAANTITAGQIAANAINASELNSNSVSATHIVAGTITATELASNCVTAVKIIADAIETNKINGNAVTSAKRQVVNSGSNTRASWSGGTGYKSYTVTHNMGRYPVIQIAIGNFSGGNPANRWWGITDQTVNSFEMQCGTDGASSLDASWVYW